MQSIHLGPVRYNAKTRAFAAPVIISDALGNRLYPCRVRADAGRNPAEIARALTAQAQKRAKLTR